jgi:hypothetical protein
MMLFQRETNRETQNPSTTLQTAADIAQQLLELAF